MSSPLPPPPKRTVAAIRKPDLPYSSTAPPTNETWKAWSKRKGSAWGKVAYEKGIVLSDRIGTKMNGWSESAGSERFYPVTGDFATHEMEKCARILRAFTVEGIGATVEQVTPDGKKQQKKVIRKIPASIIRQAKGIVIFTSMRSGIAPFGGAGGAGVILARLEDGSWSAPSATTPNNLSAGLMLGVDVYDCVLIVRTEEALNTFKSMKVTLGAEMGVAAGPYGAGAAVESGIDRSPVLSYIRSRGMFAGVEAVAQIFITRTEENETVYFWPGVTPKDILEGRTKVPREAEGLITALEDAETGRAQRSNGEEFEFDEPFPVSDTESLDLAEGEVIRLPPTPGQLSEAEEEEERLHDVTLRNEKRYLR